MPFVPYGIDARVTACTDTAAIQRIRQVFGDKLILAVGRLVPYKGFDILIRSMKHVDAKLLLIGSGPEYNALAKLAASEGVEERIAMLGRVEDVGPYFAAASFFVLPSVTRAEAFGLVQLEAMAAGLPVINTDIDSGSAEISLDGERGLLFRHAMSTRYQRLCSCSWIEKILEISTAKPPRPGLLSIYL